MKVRFIIEKGAVGQLDTVDIKSIKIKNPVIITRNFSSDQVIGYGTVKKERGILTCECDIKDDYLDLNPAIGYKLDKNI